MRTDAAPIPLAVDEPLVQGISVLEASAGTGKTYQITNLVVRLVAEHGVPMREILVVTFTRAATAELQDRVRLRLAEAASALEAEHPEQLEDPTLAGLAQRAAAAREERGEDWHHRLRVAQESFDEALISTIHGFCQRMLQQNAFESDSAFDLELLDDVRPLLEEIVDDFLAARLYAVDPAEHQFLVEDCGFRRDNLLGLAYAATSDPTMRILPGDELAASTDPDDQASLARAAFARHVRHQLDERAHKAHLQSYQDLLRKLADNLGPEAEPGRRERLARSIGERFQAALIDEFQDTDDHQWTIFRTVFGDGRHFLYLIGDPKQAIYGFRGANVHVYLDAVRHARQGGGQVRTLGRNFRSDQRLVDALNHLMRGPDFFGDPDIGYIEVDAHARDDRLRLTWPWEAPEAAPLQLRVCEEEGAAGDALRKGRLQQLLPARIAADIVDLLESDAQLEDPRRGWRAVRPGDMAVLVRTGMQGQWVQEALRRVGVPAVLWGAQSVFSSEEAAALQQWLTAVSQPGRDGPARVAATSPLFGWTAGDLLALEAEHRPTLRRWEAWQAALALWQALLERGGVMTALRRAMEDYGVARRLLSLPDGERRLTNLLHLGELAHAAELHGRLGLSGLMAWLEGQRLGLGTALETAELRLETDAAAVTVLTVHKSKGLQFPLVWVPFLWDGARLRRSARPNLVVPDPDDPTRRILNLHVDDQREPKSEHIGLAQHEIAKENLRLLYVALTRACHRCTVYTGAVDELETSPLGAALHGRDCPAGEDRLTHTEATVGDLSPTQLLADLEELAAGSSGSLDDAPTIAVSRCQPPGAGRRWAGETHRSEPLRVRVFERPGLDRVWGRHSFSALTRRAHSAPAAGDDLEHEGADHDQQPAARDFEAPPPPLELPDPPPDEVPFAEFPASAEAGTFLHEIFELLDFPAAPSELEPLLTDLLPRHGYATTQWRDRLVELLLPVLDTPLGGPLGDFRLAQLERHSRLDELRFDFPIAGGDLHGRPGHRRRVLPARLGAAFDGADLRPEYLERLRGLDFGELAGFMIGFIDLVFAAPDAAGQRRWYLADYKSNRLDPHRTGRCIIQHFTQAGMRYEMERHHYFLQLHLYALAVHRFLRQRVPDYRYDEHFGGAYYLFIRGMLGPDDTPLDGDRRHGVFFSRPDERVIDALDGLFDSPGEEGS